MMKSPCKDCNRKGCGVYHDICPEYQGYLKGKLKQYSEKKKAAELIHAIYETRRQAQKGRNAIKTAKAEKRRKKQ